MPSCCLNILTSLALYFSIVPLAFIFLLRSIYDLIVHIFLFLDYFDNKSCFVFFNSSISLHLLLEDPFLTLIVYFQVKDQLVLIYDFV